MVKIRTLSLVTAALSAVVLAVPAAAAEPGSDTAPPGSVTDLAVVSATETTVTLSWTNPADADLSGELVRRSIGDIAPSGPTDGALVTDVPVGGSALAQDTITGLTPGTTYSFAVFAHDATPNYAAPATITTTTSAMTWTPAARIDPLLGQPSDVSCPTSTFCMVIDESGYAVPNTNGVRGAAVLLDGDARLTSVSCASASFCMAVDSSGDALRFSGGSWHRMFPGIPGDIPSVSCTSSTFCIAVGGNRTSRYNGTDWTTPVDTAGSAVTLTDVSCASRTFCVAVGVGHATGGTDEWVSRGYRWNGTSWSTGGVLARYTYVDSISCVSTAFCMAAASYGNTFRFDGQSWHQIQDDLSLGGRDVSCASSTFCMGVSSESNHVEAARYDGHAWGHARSILTIGNTEGAHVSCASSTSCVAVDHYGDGRWWTGSWKSAPSVIDRTTGNLLAVSCATGPMCVAVDEFGNYVAYHGSGWTQPQRVSRWSQGMIDVACPSATFCITIDSVGRSRIYDGATWRIGPSIALAELPTARSTTGYLSCSSPTFCLAAGAGYASIFNGTAWSKPARYGGRTVHQEWGAACTAAHFCAVTTVSDPNSWLTVYRSGAWQPPVALPAGLNGPSITCAGISACMLTDYDGHVVTYRGGVLSAPLSLNRSTLGSSCVSPTFCVLDAYWDALLWNGESFNPARPMSNDVFSDDSDISCVQPTFCAAVGLFGVVTGQ
jgi:hypothetical protein